MAESYTIESADDGVPIDPEFLRELRDMLRKDKDLHLGVRLKDRPPAPGEQGALPVALEIVSAATPLGTAFAGVLMHWVNTRKVRIKVRRGHDSVELRAGNVKDAERLIAKLKS
jgi:hypothetical protein